jgi:hypothetical protein
MSKIGWLLASCNGDSGAMGSSTSQPHPEILVPEHGRKLCRLKHVRAHSSITCCRMPRSCGKCKKESYLDIAVPLELVSPLAILHGRLASALRSFRGSLNSPSAGARGQNIIYMEKPAFMHILHPAHFLGAFVLDDLAKKRNWSCAPLSKAWAHCCCFF